MRKTTRKFLAVTAGVASIALLASACSSDSNSSDDPSSSASSSESAASTEKITLKVATFNEFGYKDLYKEYMSLHPNITIVDDKAAKSDDARAAVQTAIGADTVKDDIIAADSDWMPELLETPDYFLDLASDTVKDRWPAWKSALSTTADGKLIGYGTDAGPEAICYRKDLFEKAGLASDRESVAKAIGTSWDDYFALGEKFMSKKTGAAWFDSIGALSQGMVNQLDAPFENPETDEITALDADSQIKPVYDLLTSDKVLAQSAHLQQWTPDWNAAFAKDAFATQLCPPWMTQIITGNAPDQKNWDVADVMPGGASNWGGSFLLVPAKGKNADAAKALADWLTDPVQTAKIFVQYGNFPSQTAATTDPSVTGKTDAYFGGAPTGQIFSNRFAPIEKQPYRGSHYFAINQALGDAYTRVDVTKSDSAADSWKKFETAVKDLG
ncbi:ABC transporter substrate-binding protein [Cellulomonas edaphi]|uniref:Extracellular solute-binding protein n=1 Tax=Cellulomonas edaphi TaxID=3053468 RepID=A0ABT7S8D5_9CELL|nr:extracellular solute-binding protein [Cellulomons edaphi]MDM7831789.1 extracellular solute-binding protein [Cellulomons edaphi]